MRINNLRVVIWPNDHRPAHVHAKGASSEAVFVLNCPDGPPQFAGEFWFQVGNVEQPGGGIVGGTYWLVYPVGDDSWRLLSMTWNKQKRR